MGSSDICIFQPDQYELIEHAGNLAGEVLHFAGAMVKPGANLLEIDKAAEDWILSKGHKPTFKGYHGFPNTLCMSVNDQIVHGIPSDRKLKEGDVISIDVGVSVTEEYNGKPFTYVGDNAFTFPCGEISNKVRTLLEATNAGLWAGLDAIQPGGKISDISKAIENVCQQHRYGNVEEFGGHGIGPEYHCAPFIPNYNSFFNNYSDSNIQVGMVLAVEPMFNIGSSRIKKHKDGWTITTADRKPSAHFEHSALVTEDGIRIITNSHNTREIFNTVYL